MNAIRCFSCYFCSLWWAVHNCTHLEYLNVASNRRINGQVLHARETCIRKVLVSDFELCVDHCNFFLFSAVFLRVRGQAKVSNP